MYSYVPCTWEFSQCQIIDRIRLSRSVFVVSEYSDMAIIVHIQGPADDPRRDQAVRKDTSLQRSVVRRPQVYSLGTENRSPSELPSDRSGLLPPLLPVPVTSHPRSPKPP